MNSSELAKIGALIAAEHPSFTFLNDAGGPNAKFSLWKHELEQFSANLVLESVRVHLGRSEWPPKLSNILNIIKEAKKLNILTPGDAYGEVLILISRFGYYREKQALLAATPATQRAIKRIGWREICTSDNLEALRAHFYKVYEQVALRNEQKQDLKRVYKELPSCKGLIETLSKRLDLNEQKISKK